LPDQAKALGPLDPQTLKTRAGIAYYTSETGHSQEALHLYQKLLPDQTKALDPLNYNTLAIRVNIASLTEITGDPDGALCLLRELLPDQVAAFGEDSHLVARTRSAIERLEGELEGGG
jgi:hypothetical protein